MMCNKDKPLERSTEWIEVALGVLRDNKMLSPEYRNMAGLACLELAELRRLAAIGKLVEDSEADVEAGRLTDHEDVKRELG